MTDNSHGTLAQARDHLLLTMGRNERLRHKKGQKCKMKYTHETSLGITAETVAIPAAVPKAPRRNFDKLDTPPSRLQSRFK